MDSLAIALHFVCKHVLHVLMSKHQWLVGLVHAFFRENRNFKNRNLQFTFRAYDQRLLRPLKRIGSKDCSQMTRRSRRSKREYRFDHDMESCHRMDEQPIVLVGRNKEDQ